MKIDLFPQNVSSSMAHHSNLHETAPSAASSNIDEAVASSVLPETEVGFNEASVSAALLVAIYFLGLLVRAKPTRHC